MNCHFFFWNGPSISQNSTFQNNLTKSCEIHFQKKATPDCSFYFQNELFVSPLLISQTPFSKYIKYTSKTTILEAFLAYEKAILEVFFFCLSKGHFRRFFCLWNNYSRTPKIEGSPHPYNHPIPTLLSEKTIIPSMEISPPIS